MEDEVFRVRAGGTGWFDEGDDHLAVAFVGHAYNGCVGDGRMGLQRFLDLFGEDLLPRRVDAVRAPAEEADAAVGFQRNARRRE